MSSACTLAGVLEVLGVLVLLDAMYFANIHSAVCSGERVTVLTSVLTSVLDDSEENGHISVNGQVGKVAI